MSDVDEVLTCIDAHVKDGVIGAWLGLPRGVKPHREKAGVDVCTVCGASESEEWHIELIEAIKPIKILLGLV